ncbi:MAG: hypothetical protein U0R19_40490 [Bryobacteraceae bacterium]
MGSWMQPMDFQVILGSSQLAGIPLGSKITGMGFRLPLGTPDGADFLYQVLQVIVGTSVVEPGTESASPFNNFASDRMFAIPNGALLRISKDLFIPGEFTFLPFDFAFTYRGGPLAVYWATKVLATSQLFNPSFDAVFTQPGVIGMINNFHIPNEFSSSSTAPLIALQFTAPGSDVPEPGTAMAGLACLGLALVGRLGKQPPSR